MWQKVLKKFALNGATKYFNLWGARDEAVKTKKLSGAGRIGFSPR